MAHFEGLSRCPILNKLGVLDDDRRPESMSSVTNKPFRVNYADGFDKLSCPPFLPLPGNTALLHYLVDSVTCSGEFDKIIFQVSRAFVSDIANEFNVNPGMPHRE